MGISISSEQESKLLDVQMNLEDSTILYDFDIPDETVVYTPNPMDSITTGQVNDCTVAICPTCGAHSNLNNGKCFRCDLGVYI